MILELLVAGIVLNWAEKRRKRSCVWQHNGCHAEVPFWRRNYDTSQWEADCQDLEGLRQRCPQCNRCALDLCPMPRAVLHTTNYGDVYRRKALGPGNE
jgi:hypothetical protein